MEIKFYDRAGRGYHLVEVKDFAAAAAAGQNVISFEISEITKEIKNEMKEVVEINAVASFEGQPSPSRYFFSETGNLLRLMGGENFDGKDYAAAALRKGMPVIVCSENGKISVNDVKVCNQIFSGEDGDKFFIALSTDAAAARFEGINYISIEEDKPVAYLKGDIETEFPSYLLNEKGVGYHYVSYKEEGLKLLKKRGGVWARKQASIIVYAAGSENLNQAVLNGFVEHHGNVPDGHLIAAYTTGGETWHVAPDYLEKNYQKGGMFNGGRVYNPRQLNAEQIEKHEGLYLWVHCPRNVFGILWGGFEFLVTPMINITLENDVYGCNYARWWGTDGLPATYEAIDWVDAEIPEYLINTLIGKLTSVVQSTLNPPKQAAAC